MPDHEVIYVIFGSAGQYSDWSMWPVRAWENAEGAAAFLALLNAARARLGLVGIENLDFDAAYDLAEAASKDAELRSLDCSSQFRVCHGNGVHYEIQAVPRGFVAERKV